MSRKHTGSLVVAALVLLAGSARGQEQRIKRSDLPLAVERAVAAQSQGATIRGFSREREQGQTFYEVELVVQGHGRDVLLDSAGAVVEVEEEMSPGSLPAAVLAGLTARAGAGKLLKIESITKQGRLVAYEAQVVTGGKRSEVQVGPDGKPLDHEE
jgi:hypothetical protein